MSIKKIALEKNNSLIVEKPSNPMGTKEENRYRKSQVYLAFLLFIVNQSTIAAKITKTWWLRNFHSDSDLTCIIDN